MLNQLRAPLGRVLAPLVERLSRAGVSPDAVTVVGTVGTVVSSLVFFTRGAFFVGTIVVTVFVLFDLLDGAMARQNGGTSRWGAFLDSTMDRISDAAIFGSLVLWYAGRGDSDVLAAVALFCLVAGAVVSYAKARAEGLGMRCDVGVAERSERLVIGLGGTLFGGAGLPYVLPGALWLLAVASTVTVGQRMVEVHRQAALARSRTAP